MTTNNLYQVGYSPKGATRDSELGTVFVSAPDIPTAEKAVIERLAQIGKKDSRIIGVNLFATGLETTQFQLYVQA